jgi:hypothetical protein
MSKEGPVNNEVASNRFLSHSGALLFGGDIICPDALRRVHERSSGTFQSATRGNHAIRHAERTQRFACEIRIDQEQKRFRRTS